MASVLPSFAIGRNGTPLTMGNLQRLASRKEAAAKRDLTLYGDQNERYRETSRTASATRAAAYSWTSDPSSEVGTFLKSRQNQESVQAKVARVGVAQAVSKSFPSQEHSFANMPKAAQDYSRKYLRQQRKPIPEWMQKGYTPSTTAGLGKSRRG